MHSKLDPEDRVLEDILEEEEEDSYFPKLDGYACPYPRRKLRTPTKDETYYSQ
jgi:hypothetical protein